MPTNTTPKKTIQSTVTAFDVIEAVAEGERPTISEIAAQVDHSRSTVHYHLKTLQQEGYVTEDDSGFRLGLRMARLGELSLQHHRLTGVVEQPTEDLAAETGATAHVAVEEGDGLVWLYRASSESGDVPTAVGAEVPMHCTAYGHAILGHSTAAADDLPESADLSAATPRTLTDRDALAERLDTVRDLGFAYSAEEFVEGIGSIAAPILDGSGDVAGSIGISDDIDRIDDPYKHAKARRFSDELPGLVRKAAQITSDHLSDR